FQSSLMSKTYLKSDHFNGGGSYRRAHSGDTQGLHLGMPGSVTTPWLRPMSFICHWPGATQWPRCSASGPALADVSASAAKAVVSNKRRIFLFTSGYCAARKDQNRQRRRAAD